MLIKTISQSSTASGHRYGTVLALVAVIYLLPAALGARRVRRHTDHIETVRSHPDLVSAFHQPCSSNRIITMNSRGFPAVAGAGRAQNQDFLGGGGDAEARLATGLAPIGVLQENVLTSVEGLMERLDLYSERVDSSQCVGLNLDSLPVELVPEGTNHHTINLHFYRFLTNIRAHLRMMRLDWAGPGYPCGGRQATRNNIFSIQELDNYVGGVLCPLKTLLTSDIESVAQLRMESDLTAAENAAVDARIYRYSNCNIRKLRDCVVISRLSRYISGYQQSLRSGNVAPGLSMSNIE